jgi:dihydroxyacetone kinase-like protein
MALTIDETLKLLDNMESIITENRQFLTDLDAAIGDGDHGINMSKGFKAVVEKLHTSPVKSWGDIFKLTGMALVSTVGGASGPLYGTAFIKASAVGTGKAELSIEDFKGILEAAINGIKMRGGADKGDKTMLDALIPALEAAKSGLEDNLPSIEVLKKAYEASEAGVEFTKTIAARKGRASYLGDRSIGFQDPGATSSTLLLKCTYESVKAFREA